MGSGTNSIKAKLESVWRQTGHRPKELDNLVEMPEALQYIWDDFRSLNASRSSNGYSANPLSYSEIMYYCLLTGTKLQPWEVELLKYFDTALMNLYAEEAAKQKK